MYGFGEAKMSYELKYKVLEDVKKIEHHTQLHRLILSSNNLRRYEGIPVKEVVNMYRELVDYIKKSTEKKIIFCPCRDYSLSRKWTHPKKIYKF